MVIIWCGVEISSLVSNWVEIIFGIDVSGSVVIIFGTVVKVVVIIFGIVVKWINYK